MKSSKLYRAARPIILMAEVFMSKGHRGFARALDRLFKAFKKELRFDDWAIHKVQDLATKLRVFNNTVIELFGSREEFDRKWGLFALNRDLAGFFMSVPQSKILYSSRVPE